MVSVVVYGLLRRSCLDEVSDAVHTHGEVVHCDEMIATHQVGKTLTHLEEGLWRKTWIECMGLLCIACYCNVYCLQYNLFTVLCLCLRYLTLTWDLNKVLIT